jgi:anti-sigma B factor antagonist
VVALADNVAVEERGSTAVLRVLGDLDLRSGPGVERAVTHQLASGWRNIVVDLGGVEFMDSSGLGALVGSWRAVKRVEGTFRIAHPTGQVRRILAMTGLDRLFPSVDAELRGASGPPPRGPA